jgi:multiple sugar transport system permease protein
MSRKDWLYGLLCVLCVPFVFPTWWMVTSSMKPISEIFSESLLPSEWTFSTYEQVFRMQPFGQQYWNSLYIAVIVTAGTMAVAALAGYAFARIRFPGQNVLFVVVLTGLLIPSEVTIVPLFQMFQSLGMTNTHWPLIIVPIFGAPSVLATFVMRQFFITIPGELEEAGRLDGLSRFGLYRRVAMPIAKPALAAVAIFTFLNTWNFFLEPLVYLTDKDKFTLPVALTQYVDVYGGHLWNVQLAAATTTVVPVLLVFIIAQRQFVEGLAQSGLKG